MGRSEAPQNAAQAVLSDRISWSRRRTRTILRAKAGSGKGQRGRREPVDKRRRQESIGDEESNDRPDRAGFGGSFVHRDQDVGAPAITRQLALATSRPSLLIIQTAAHAQGRR